ncbi:MAG: xanthine dehydrogenase family protein, partial [Chloroflexi bacterium]|nr:xanthine dehydrogenase family protein [Chloroflexota bacterium]
MADSALIGAPIRRREDAALLTGRGRYVDDLHPLGTLRLALLRSPYPKARIASINLDQARAMPGVEAVLSGADVDLEIHTPSMAPGMKIPPHPVLAREAVYAPGTPVAAVVATTAQAAYDAIEAIEVEYEPLPSVADVEAALASDAPRVRDELADNICYTVSRSGGDLERAFAEADHIAELRIASPRLAAVALETRGALAVPDPIGDGFTLWLTTQAPHRTRGDLAASLRFPEQNIRIIAPDVGGGFGSKGALYREYVLVCHLALRLGRPIKWISTRSEDLISTMQGRDLTMYAQLAVKRDGTMTGMKVRLLASLGGYLQSSTAGPPMRMLAMATGAYTIPNVQVEVTGVFTNTVYTGPYRGAGRPESVLAIERMTDQAARDLGIDPLEMRRRNFIKPDQFPYKAATGAEYDSGNYERALDEALELSGYDQLVRDREAARGRGELAGIGFSTFVEPSGGAGFESGAVRIERSGAVTVLTGASSHGQGHETVFSQVAAERLGIPMESILVRHGDTAVVQQGVGTFGSRSAVMAGGALSQALDRIIDKAKKIAAHLLEASVDDIVGAEGGFEVAGAATRKVTWQQIAAAAYTSLNLPAGMEAGLQETVFYNPKREAWPFGTHIAYVSINRETGQLRLEKLVCVDDCGVVINPLIVEGQIHGGLAQGLGEVFGERMIFDSDGTVMTATLMDYGILRAP